MSLSHHSTSTSLAPVFGADLPVKTTEAARLDRIKRQAAASEAVLALLADIAFGPSLDTGWPPPNVAPRYVTTEARA